MIMWWYMYAITTNTMAWRLPTSWQHEMTFWQKSPYDVVFLFDHSQGHAFKCWDSILGALNTLSRNIITTDAGRWGTTYNDNFGFCGMRMRLRDSQRLSTEGTQCSLQGLVINKNKLAVAGFKEVLEDCSWNQIHDCYRKWTTRPHYPDPQLSLLCP